MKRILILIALTLSVATSRADVVFFPYQYSIFSYSLEGIYSFEKVINSKTTINYWGGVGCVGSFLLIDRPYFGFEMAIEKRRYFKPDKFEGLNFSGYLGTAIMHNPVYSTDLGIIPGVKLTHKSYLASKVIFEPYVSVSIPVSFELPRFNSYVPFPVATVGIRLGFNKLKYPNNS